MLVRPELSEDGLWGDELLGSRRFEDHLASLVRDHGLAYTERGVWVVVGQAGRAYGWKLHLSSVQVHAEALLSRVLPILRAWHVPFKIARNLTILGLLNEGALGDTQVGKFATIYPPDNARARNLARELIESTGDFVGPRIVTDRHLGTIVYARYGPFNPSMHRNRLGLFEPADAEQASAAAYRVPFSVPNEIEDPFHDFVCSGRDDLLGRDVHPIGPGYLVIGVIARHAKGCVYQAIDLRDRASVRTVVLKEGRMHCMSDAEGRAMAERIANQIDAHARASAVGVAPVADSPFRFGDSLFLPIEYVPGRDLGSRPPTPFGRLSSYEQRTLLQSLTATARAIATLHQAGVVHRDLSMRNIRIRDDGEVFLIDLEIAHVDPKETSSHEAHRRSRRPFMQGTPGFVSPQQLAGAPASIADDVFGLGAVLICALTGLDPQRVIFAHAGVDQEGRERQIIELSGASMRLCRVAAACVAADPAERPSMAAIVDELGSSCESEPGTSMPMPEMETGRFDRLAGEGAKWLIEGAGRDEQTGMWKSPDIEAANHASIKLVHAYKIYRSANLGVAGVVYALSKLVRFGFGVEGARRQVGHAVDWLLDHQPTSDDQMTGLHFGETGVALAIAEALAAGLIDRGPWTTAYYREVFNAPIDWPDLTHGAAGQGLGALACAALLADDAEIVAAAMAHVARCTDFLCASQASEGCWLLPAGVSEMSGKPYTGLAHGVAGPLAFLSHPAVFHSRESARDSAVRAANWLLDEARAGEGGLYLWWPMTPEEPRAWSWWCHGGPGIAVGLLAHHAVTGDPGSAAAARAALRGQPFEARHANLSQCHGLAGLGEIYLDAYLKLGEMEWLERALAIGRVLANLARRDDLGASWLVENPYVPTPDLMVGTAGVVHFLARLVRLEAGFGPPLYPPATMSFVNRSWTA